MKKICTLAIIAAICIGLTGCGGGKDSAQPEESTASEGAAGELTAGTTPPQLVNHTPTDETQSTATDADGNLLPYGYSTEQILARADNSKPAEEMITKAYPAKAIFDRVGVYFNANLHSGFVIRPELYNSWFEIECLRDMGDGNYYAITKVEEGGYFFAFFPSHSHHCLDYTVYIQEPLNKTRFDRLKKGQSMADVAKLDPVVQIFIDAESTQMAFNATQGGNICYTYHMFNDCMYLISYIMQDPRSSDPSGIHILDIRKFPDHKLILDMTYEEDGVTKQVYGYGTHDFSILPQDYPR